MVLSSEPDEINLERKPEDILEHLVLSNEPDEINLERKPEDILEHLVLSSEPDEINLEQKPEKQLVLSSEPNDINSEQKNNVNYQPNTALENIIAVADVTEEITKDVYAYNVIDVYTSNVIKSRYYIATIIEIYEKAQFNKNICKSLLHRAQSAEVAIYTLQRRKQENKEKLLSRSDTITGISKYINASSIEDKFLELMSDYDKCMEDLQFTFIISQDIQKRYDRFLNHFRENVQGTLKFVQGPLSILRQEVSIIKTQLGTDTQILAPRIDPTLLKDIEPEEPSINSNNIAVAKNFYIEPEEPLINFTKKFYTKNAIAVSCKTIMDPIRFQSQKKQGHLAILGKLGECPSILKLFWVSTIKDSITLREY
ncbi:411_t:CDS:2 [Cetraspora pellucida]|uniref:411_t:CDS:1 n=1 Tax=Cetraspora pellucida TaxID=1433469 RepID=A0ACA9M5J4_9GLOM|nr:411_t:CDS:2 [Cetraspora pellucida]